MVGAGSAGCVLASRLARDFGIHVTLLEPPPNTDSFNPAPAIDLWRPARWLNQLGSTEDWNLKTEPSANLAARSIAWPRGRGLGGSSRINAMIWFPPTTIDLSMLCEASDNRWNLAELESAYRSVESLVRPELPRWLSEPSHHFLEAAAGYSHGAPMVYRRLCRRGRRWLPCELLPTEKGRVTIVRGVVDRLIWENENVVGVHVRGEHDDFDLYVPPTAWCFPLERSRRL